ncbi:hypothetical protein [Salinibaculum rarum]|uniref:hypothetical protein n=1 Tax=Salinibaculum rarum TaxID=3058903 RepID=UPI00265FF590|nr:hypothetical protein [Salinibaculum sp. KK48]
MDQLSPHHVPVYETREQQRRLWEQCAERGQPVVAVRDAHRGYIVRYDLQHLDTELSAGALARLRKRTRDWRTYPTATDGGSGAGTDPLSESEGVGGEAGPVSGDLHTDSEQSARQLASRLSAVVFDRGHWQ